MSMPAYFVPLMYPLCQMPRIHETSALLHACRMPHDIAISVACAVPRPSTYTVLCASQKLS